MCWQCSMRELIGLVTMSGREEAEWVLATEERNRNCRWRWLFAELFFFSSLRCLLQTAGQLRLPEIRGSSSWLSGDGVPVSVCNTQHDVGMIWRLSGEKHTSPADWDPTPGALIARAATLRRGALWFSLLLFHTWGGKKRKTPSKETQLAKPQWTFSSSRTNNTVYTAQLFHDSLLYLQGKDVTVLALV